MTGETFEELVRWQKAKSSRSITISTEKYGSSEISAFVYDYDLKMGQIVSSVAEIDLQKKRNEQLDEWIAERERSRSVADGLLSQPPNSG